MCEYGDDEDLPGARHDLDVEVGAGDAEYEMAAARLKEPVASSDHEDGNQNTVTGVTTSTDGSSLYVFADFCTYFHLFIP